MGDSVPEEPVDTDRESHLVGCSVKGPSHEESGEPCQDSWAGTQLSDSRFVLAVADGLGSASHSHIGSEVAVDTFVSHMQESVSDGPVNKTSLKDEFKLAFESTRSTLQDEADRQGVSLSDLNTTLLAAAGGPSGVGAAAVGDGGVVRVHRENFHPMVPREDSEYANRTTPIQSDRWQESYRFGYSNEVDGVAAFSDGLENIAWAGRNSPQDALFKQFFNFVWYTSDVDRINNELSNFLDHERYRDISVDDKTIAIATLEIDYEERERNTSSVEGSATGSSTSDSESESTQTMETHTGLDRERSATDDPTVMSGKTADSVEMTGDHGDFSSRPGAPNSSMQAGRYEGEVLKVNGETLHLRERFTTDLSGTFYTTDKNNYSVVKIFNQEKRNQAQEDKIMAMIRNSPSPPKKSFRNIVFQWPVATVTDYSEEKFLGCAFEFQIPEESQRFEDFAQDIEINRSFGARIGSLLLNLGAPYAKSRVNRYNTSIDLAAAVSALHQQGIAVVNFDPRSIFITDSSLIFSSCDQFAFDTGSTYYPGAEGHKRYKPKSNVDRSIEAAQYADRFGLSVYVYQLLLQGAHPFKIGNRRDTSNGNLIKDQLKPHIARNFSDTDTKRSEERAYARLPRNIRSMFKKCFVDGFDVPEKRPSPKNWVNILNNELR